MKDKALVKKVIGKVGKGSYNLGKKFPTPLRLKSKGQIQIMVGILLGFMVVTMMVTLIPGFVEMFDTAQNSENLNCKGYSDVTNAQLSYNATIGTKSSIACLAVKLYLPYIILAVLIGLVLKILYERTAQQQPSY